MGTAALCAVMLTVAVDIGYEPMPGGGIRYLIQIEPHMLDALRDGETLGSDIAPAVRGRIHSFRIVSNYGELPTEIPPAPAKEPLLPPLGPPPEDTSLPTQPLALTQEADLSPSDSPPRPFLDPGHVKPAVAEMPTRPSNPNVATNSGEPKKPESTPWFPLVLLAVVATGSSSGMLYFGWLAFDYRSRYLGLLRDAMKSGSSWLDDPLERPQRNAVVSTSNSESASSRQPETDWRDPETSAAESAWSEMGEERSDSLGGWLDGDDDQEREGRDGKKLG